MKFIIYGIPLAKQGDRSRIIKGKNGNTFVHHYTDGKIKKMEENLRAQIVSQLPQDFIPFNGPIRVKNILFVFPPVSSLKKKEKLIIENDGYLWKSTKPDLTDNLMKGIFDAMEGIIFVNDSKICEIIHTAKCYGLKPRIEIELEAINENEKVTINSGEKTNEQSE